MMELFVIVTTPGAGGILAPLVRACDRAGIPWGVFFTHDGVRALEDREVVAALSPKGRAVACQESWCRLLPDRECPVELGSQTSNSALLSEAKRVMSL